MEIQLSPPVLYRASEALKKSASVIQQAVETVDHVVTALNAQAFEGQSAAFFHQRFQGAREQILSTDEKVIRFSEWLAEIARRFEEADRQLSTQQPDVPGEAKVIPFIKGRGDNSDIDPSDVSQGQIGDCYLIATLGALAQQNPEAIRRLIKANADGSFTVTLYRRKLFGGYEEVQIHVSPEDLESELDGMTRADYGDASGSQSEAWARILEAAYAEFKGGYENIDGGGIATDPLSCFTGQDSTFHLWEDFTDLQNHFEQGDAIVAGTANVPEIFQGIGGAREFMEEKGLTFGHAYYVTGVDAETQTVRVRNPWGWNYDEISLTFDEFKSAFLHFSTNPIS